MPEEHPPPNEDSIPQLPLSQLELLDENPVALKDENSFLDFFELHFGQLTSSWFKDDL